MTSLAVPAASELVRAQKARVTGVAIGLTAAAVVLGSLGGSLVVAGHVAFVFFLAAAALPLLFWKLPASPVVFLVAAGCGIERFADTAPDAITAKIPLFRSFTESYGISGGVLLPIEVVFGLALLVWLARAVSERRLRFGMSQLGAGIGILLLGALITEGYGLARGGVFNVSLWELRPFLYLALAYLLASQLLTTRSAYQAVLWAMVVGTGLKGLLGTERVITLAQVFPRPDALLEHEESFFFSCYILLTVALWVFGQRGRLRTVATALLPLVVVADLGNNRRAAWVMLPTMLMALAVIAYQRMPERRKTIAWLVGGTLLVGAGYVAVFHQSSSLVAQPARAIWSQYRPDPRDASSNLYRQLETADLGIDIRASPVIGEGFGVPIAHPIPLYDATNVDPLINFIPHNNILYLWLRMGLLGMLSFWFIVGAGVIAACRLARQGDQLAALFGTLVVAALIAWLFQGWLDKGIISFRITIVVGCLLGGLGAMRTIGSAHRQPQSEGNESKSPVLRGGGVWNRAGLPSRELGEPAAGAGTG